MFDMDFLMCILLYVSFIRLHVFAFTIQSLVHCGSAFQPGASRLHYYCTPPACLPAVLGALAVLRQNNQKKEHAEPMRVLNSGEHGRRGTCHGTGLKHVEDRHARARVPREGGRSDRPHALG